MNNGLMGVCYMVGLFWLCGIGIISDIFMEAIEVMVS